MQLRTYANKQVDHGSPYTGQVINGVEILEVFWAKKRGDSATTEHAEVKDVTTGVTYTDYLANVT